MVTRPASGWGSYLADVAAELALPIADTAALSTWLDALVEWNAKIDLTAAKDATALVWLMLADAMVLAPRIAKGARVVDVGTGAGAPGLALAILRSDLRVTLAEPLGKRAAFLRTVIGSIGRTDVTLLPKRGEALDKGAFDVAISRATLPPEEWLALGKTLVAAGGDVWVFLAEGEAPPGQKEEIAWTEPPGKKRRLVRYA
ncbi:MAG TPA: RsmG family class I SAM-dependent methyltransferase [Polyangiaceae bacterium]